MGKKQNLSTQELPKKIIFPGKEERDLEQFRKIPVLAIVKFLDCFDPDGRQAYVVPRHILETLWRNFNLFMSGKCGSIDKAFGGKTARQRKAFNLNERDKEIVFEFFGAWESAKKLSVTKRSKSTPFEYAVAKSAEKYGLSEDAIRDIYKRLGRRR